MKPFSSPHRNLHFPEGTSLAIRIQFLCPFPDDCRLAIPLWSGSDNTPLFTLLLNDTPETLDLQRISIVNSSPVKYTHTLFNCKDEFLELSKIILAFRKDENYQKPSRFKFEGNLIVNGKRVKRWFYSLKKRSKMGKHSKNVSWNPALRSSAGSDGCSFVLQVTDVSEKVW